MKTMEKTAMAELQRGQKWWQNLEPQWKLTFKEAVVQWKAPSGENKGDVFFVKEVSSNTFTISCTDGAAATGGTITHFGR